MCHIYSLAVGILQWPVGQLAPLLRCQRYLYQQVLQTNRSQFVGLWYCSTTLYLKNRLLKMLKTQNSLLQRPPIFVQQTHGAPNQRISVDSNWQMIWMLWISIWTTLRRYTAETTQDSACAHGAAAPRALIVRRWSTSSQFVEAPGVRVRGFIPLSVSRLKPHQWLAVEVTRVGHPPQMQKHQATGGVHSPYILESVVDQKGCATDALICNDWI